MRGLVKGLVVAFVSVQTILNSTAAADHRPGNVALAGGTWALSGYYSSASSSFVKGRQLYVEELNARGGLLGHKVELVILDDQSDRRTAIELYEKLIVEDAVDIVLGPYGSSITDSVANVMERHRRPFIALGAVSPIIFQRGRKYVFRPISAVSQDYQKGAIHLAKNLGVKKIAIIGEASQFPRQITEGALKWAKRLNMEVVLLESYRKDQTDFTDVLNRIKASDAEAIFSNGYFIDSVNQIRQLNELNFDIKLYSAALGPATPGFVGELGELAEYVIGFSQWEPRATLGNPDAKQFIENYQRRFGEIPNYRAARGYTEMQILEAAITKAGSFEPNRVRDSLASITVQTIMGPWRVDESGFMSIDGTVIQIQNGKRVIVWPSHLSEGRFRPMQSWRSRALP